MFNFSFIICYYIVFTKKYLNKIRKFIVHTNFLRNCLKDYHHGDEYDHYMQGQQMYHKQHVKAAMINNNNLPYT